MRGEINSRDVLRRTVKGWSDFYVEVVVYFF